MTPWTVAYQAPPSMGFSRQEYWSGLLFPSPGDSPSPGIEPTSPALKADALSSETPGKFSVPLKSLQTDKVPIRMWVPRNEHSLPDVVRLVPSSSLELAFYLYCSVLTQSLLSKKLHHGASSRSAGYVYLPIMS